MEIHFKDKSRLYFSWNLNSLVENDNYSLKYSRLMHSFPMDYQKYRGLSFINGKLHSFSGVMGSEEFHPDLVKMNLKNLEKRIKQINRYYLTLWLFVCKHVGFRIKDLKIYLFEKFLVIK